MSLRIVPAGLADIDAVVALMRGAFDKRYGEAWSGAQLTAAFATGDTWAAFAREGDAPAGFVLTRRILDEAELLLVAVRPEARGQGAGRALVTETCRAAKQRGAASLFLEVRESNEAALSLYRAMDFSEVGRRSGYYLGSSGERFDAITMRRDLLGD